MLAYSVFLVASVRPKMLAWTTRRAVWTFGWLMFFLHLIVAFHYYHSWSHSHAIKDTAEKTEALIGWAFGEGIYFSYLFLIVWLFDVIWMWAGPISYRNRTTGISILVHGYLLFIVVNGTAVFESGVTRWATVAVAIGLAVLVLVPKQTHTVAVIE